MQSQRVSSAAFRSRPGDFIFMTLAALGPPGTWRGRQVTPTPRARSPVAVPSASPHASSTAPPRPRRASATRQPQ
eukprot:scaffold31771_cov129-Isochrysis_galbana.AAC.9